MNWSKRSACAALGRCRQEVVASINDYIGIGIPISVLPYCCPIVVHSTGSSIVLCKMFYHSTASIIDCHVTIPDQHMNHAKMKNQNAKMQRNANPMVANKKQIQTDNYIIPNTIFLHLSSVHTLINKQQQKSRPSEGSKNS